MQGGDAVECARDGLHRIVTPLAMRWSACLLIPVGVWGRPIDPNELTGREAVELFGSEAVSEALFR